MRNAAAAPSTKYSNERKTVKIPNTHGLLPRSLANLPTRKPITRAKPITRLVLPRSFDELARSSNTASPYRMQRLNSPHESLPFLTNDRKPLGVPAEVLTCSLDQL